MSNFHFDLSLKLPQGEVHDFSEEVQKFSGEVRTFPHLPSKSGHVMACAKEGRIKIHPVGGVAH
jgi:hypothetical protein